MLILYVYHSYYSAIDSHIRITCIILRKWITFIGNLNVQGIVYQSQLLSIANHTISDYTEYFALVRVFSESVDSVYVLEKRCSGVENKLEIMYNPNIIFSSTHKYCIFNFQNVHKKVGR